MMNKIRAAVVGAGIYGKHHMNAYRHNPDTVLVAICDTDTERCDDLAMTYGVIGYTRLDILLQEEAIDVVSVATPDPYHTESILTALRHGKHVLAEKPLATSVRECELIVETARQRDLLVGVDFHKRWDPAVMRIKAELERPGASCAGISVWMMSSACRRSGWTGRAQAPRCGSSVLTALTWCATFPVRKWCQCMPSGRSG